MAGDGKLKSKSLLLVIASLATQACATTPNLNCDEECALRGMLCGGVSISRGSSTLSGHGRNASSYYTGKSEDESVQCDVPKNAKEEEFIIPIQETAITKVEEASVSSTRKTLLLIVGVLLFGLASMP